jgi:oxygen-independent coproporphyrinogen-3 oxidase
MDLIYGSPLLTDAMWKQNVDGAIDLGIPHLSCYALTVEEKTPLYKLIQTKKTVNVDSEKQARQFLLLMQWLKEKGYEHYEVSNFARPGYRSRHNSSYWKGAKYLGIGPSAHSYNGVERRWNIANNNVYVKSVKEDSPKRETEILSTKDRLNETIMISLRTKEGLDLSRIAKAFGINESKRIEQGLDKYICSSLVQLHGAVAQLTNEGMLRADGIAADLFV